VIGLALSFDLLQAPAAVLGMTGAMLVAGQSSGVRRWGFGCWTVGNLLWVVYGLVECVNGESETGVEGCPEKRAGNDG